MTIEDIRFLIKGDEHRTLEMKKSTGELKDAMKSACAFLNTEGGYLIFGITPTSLRIVGQKVTDSTQREIAQELAKIEPAIDARAEFVEVPDSGGQQLIVYHFDAWQDEQVPYTYNGCPYYRIESTTKIMPRDMYNERLRKSSVQSDGYIVKIVFRKGSQQNKAASQGELKTIQKETDTMQETIQKDTDTMQETIQKKLSERAIKVTKRQLDILVYFSLHPSATRKDYINSDAKITEGGTKSNIERLISLGLLRREGGRKNGKWIVVVD